MLGFLGTAGVVAGLAGYILLAVRAFRTARTGERSGSLAAPVQLALGGSVVAMAALVLALLTDDFSMSYVANHHASTTPFPFNVASAWGALEGSIVLWGLVLSVFTWSVHRRHRMAPDALGAGALGIMGVVGVFFFGLMITVSNPFEVCVLAAERSCLQSSPWPFMTASAPLEGAGPNPLLQNHYMMAIHPPILYTGYVGLTVPFAYAISALLLRVPGPEWLYRSHRSTLFAWSFLTAGIVLGGWWAYEVLSWGGYWAWDPVENASFMPWLVATAFLHSAIVQQRRNMLQAWNFVLVISMFSLTILGTFLTRSGTINSVHSFTQSAIGPALLGFLVVVLAGSLTLFAFRSSVVSSAPRIKSLVSREGAFLGNNLILTLYAFVVLVGTTYPLFLEAFTGTQVGVGGPFYNRLALPLTFALLLIMGIGPITPWGSPDIGHLWARLRLPIVVSLSAGVIVALMVTRTGWVVLATVMGSFVIANLIGLLMTQARARARKTGTSVPRSVGHVLKGDGAFWAGQVSHVGVILVALGIAFASNLANHDVVEMEPGDNVRFAGFELIYESPFQFEEPQRTVRGARISVIRDDQLLAVMEPTANFYANDSAGIITPDVMTRSGGDLYLSLRRIDSSSITLALDTSPLVWLIWLGGLTTSTGGFLAFVSRRRERLSTEHRQKIDV